MGQMNKRFKNFLSKIIILEIRHQGTIDFDDVGLDHRYTVKIGMTLTHVVQGDEKPMFAVDVDEFFQSLHVLHFGLQYLNDNIGGIQVELTGELNQLKRANFLVDNRGFKIKGQNQFVRLGTKLVKAMQCFFAHQPVEFQCETGFPGDFQQWKGGNEISRNGMDSTGKPLETHNHFFADGKNRLEVHFHQFTFQKNFQVKVTIVGGEEHG